jgi:uncharacterized RDD family membrane protein YckC
MAATEAWTPAQSLRACVAHPDRHESLETCARCGAPLCGDCWVLLLDQPFCQACKVEHVRDLLSGLEPGALDLSSTLRRFGALWLDSLITSMGAYAVMIPVSLLAGAMGTAAGDNADIALMVMMMIIYPIMFGLPVVYEALLLARNGQTVGKMALGIRVVTPDGGPLTRGQAWGRALLKMLLGSCLMVDYIPAFFTRERTCLHDLIVRTRVIRVDR